VKYIVLYPLGSNEISECLSKWITQAGGSMTLDALFRRMAQRFGHTLHKIFDPTEVQDQELVKHAYRYEDGNVSLI